MRSHLKLRWQHAAVIGGAAATAAAIALPGAFAAGPPAPFFGHGTNGNPPPNNGSAIQVNEGLGGRGALLTSVSSGDPTQAGYGLVGVKGGDGTAKTFGQLTDVETEFNVTQGTCSGGAPRWVIHVSNPSNPKQTHALLVYFNNDQQPYGGCNAGTQQETNIINNPLTGWWDGYSANSPSTYSQMQDKYGTWTLQNVEVVVDGAESQSRQLHPNVQQVLLQNLKVNSARYFRIPS